MFRKTEMIDNEEIVENNHRYDRLDPRDVRCLNTSVRVITINRCASRETTAKQLVLGSFGEDDRSLLGWQLSFTMSICYMGFKLRILSECDW